MVTNDMDLLKAEFRKLERTVGDIHGKLDEVHGAIIGNPLTQDGGIAKRLSKAEQQLNDLEERLEVAERKQLKYNLYIIIMWTCVGGVAMAIFTYILQLIFKLK